MTKIFSNPEIVEFLNRKALGTANMMLKQVFDELQILKNEHQELTDIAELQGTKIKKTQTLDQIVETLPDQIKEEPDNVDAVLKICEIISNQIDFLNYNADQLANPLDIETDQELEETEKPARAKGQS